MLWMNLNIALNCIKGGMFYLIKLGYLICWILQITVVKKFWMHCFKCLLMINFHFYLYSLLMKNGQKIGKNPPICKHFTNLRVNVFKWRKKQWNKNEFLYDDNGKLMECW